jgi:hypothetical protein
VAYKVKRSGENGYGLVATQDIRRGEILLTGLPALIVDNAFKENSMANEDSRQFSRLFRQLPGQNRVLALARSADERSLESILQTYTFEITIDGIKYTGLFPEISVSTRVEGTIKTVFLTIT